MSRYGNGSAGFDTVHVLAAGSVPAAGPKTLIVYVRVEQAGSGGIIQARDAGGNPVRSILWEADGASAVKFYTDGDFTGSPSVPVGQWTIVGLTKGAGTMQSRWHIGTPADGWTHAAGGTVPDQTGPVDHIWLGRAYGRIDGEWTAAAWLDVELTDGDFTAAGLPAGLAAWAALGPVALWDANQAAEADPILDRIGGADETSIVGSRMNLDVDDPPGWSYALGTLITGTAAADLGALTAAAAGHRTVHGLGTAPLGVLTAAAAGQHTVHGTAATDLGVLTATITTGGPPAYVAVEATTTAAGALDTATTATGHLDP